ncbi:unnamed protein product [Gongylonema pulchrum]|uniref:Uncharacterized protein n=1 Tax=Gongylonema pulchrum TaxID=637853 RepID=A0A3P6T3J2_9BILA|nr:unnamed protein product [Gongylonema pulchrum]
MVVRMVECLLPGFVSNIRTLWMGNFWFLT